MAGRNQSGSKIALALAGGGPEGAIYEIGALRALDEALDGVDFTNLPIYVGVSAGAFVGACLANGLTPKQLVRGVVDQLPYGNPIEAQTFFTPAIREFLYRGWITPGLFIEALWDYVARGDSLLPSMSRMSGSVPVALFDNEPIREYLRRVFTHQGRTDDFRQLKCRLTVVAADLDSATATLFGEPGFDHVPISKAVQASAAMPGLYPPVLIDGHHYVDGVLLKTLHASVALDQDADLVVCVNPIVPIDISKESELGLHGRSLVSEGLPMVLSQTLRTIIHSRMTVGMAAYAPRYPDRDVILFEPGPDDSRMFFTYIFSFSARKTICEHAYRLTRADLLERYAELAPMFQRHGIRLCKEVLEDQDRTVWTGMAGEPDITTPVTQRLDHLLTRLESWLEEE
ncbi:MAG: patatin-like phospholipase family protein [Bacteroidales bacterium]